MANYRPNLLQETLAKKAAIEAKIVALKQELEAVGRERDRAIADIQEASSKLLTITEATGSLEESVEAYALTVSGAQSAANDLLRTTVALADKAREVLKAVQAKAEAVVSDLENQRKEVQAKASAVEEAERDARRQKDDLKIYRARIERAAEQVGIKVII